MKKEIQEILNEYEIKFNKSDSLKNLIQILKNSDKVNWYWISIFQKLSKKMIKEFSDKVNWDYISQYQKLSEEFIKENSEKVDWNLISICQKLSEKFIREFSYKVCWYSISKYQKLSEEFIKENSEKVCWYYISKYQKLSEKFIKEFDLKIQDNNWIYKSNEFKLNYLKNNTDYEILNDEFVIAFKSVRSNNYSVYNFQYKYEIGKEYTSHCDCNQNNENSFGLSSWTKEKALEYHNKGKLLKVKIPIKNIGAIVHDSNKIKIL